MWTTGVQGFDTLPCENCEKRSSNQKRITRDLKSSWITKITNSLLWPLVRNIPKKPGSEATRVVTLQDGWARWSAGGQCCGSPQGRFVIPANRPRKTTVLQGESSYSVVKKRVLSIFPRKRMTSRTIFFVFGLWCFGTPVRPRNVKIRISKVSTTCAMALFL